MWEGPEYASRHRFHSRDCQWSALDSIAHACLGRGTHGKLDVGVLHRAVPLGMYAPCWQYILWRPPEVFEEAPISWR